jgi:hypothetical protein
MMPHNYLAGYITVIAGSDACNLEGKVLYN